MSGLNTQVQSFLTKKIYPNFGELEFAELFTHLAPSLQHGDRMTLMCPKCAENAEYYLGTGAIYCERCKSIDLLDALSLFNKENNKNNIRMMADAAAVQLPIDIYTQLLPERPKLFEVIKDIARPSVVPPKLEQLGITNEQLKVFSNLVYIDDGAELIQVLTSVYGHLPIAISQTLVKYKNCYAVVVMANSRIIFIELDGTASSPLPFVRNYIKGSNTTLNVYISDDPLFVELCWSMGLVAYLVNLKVLTDKANAYLEKFLAPRHTIAVWGREVPSSNQLTFINETHQYDWFSKRKPGCYHRIIEVCR